MCTIFDSISSNIDDVLSINPNANVFVFGDFHVHHKDWLTYSGGTDRTGELFYNFSISYDLTQMGNFPTRIPDCDSHGPSILYLFISSDVSICSTMAFPPLGNSDRFILFRLELMYISFIENIRSSLFYLAWFSAACTACIVHRNHFFRLYQMINLLILKFRLASNHRKRVLELPNFHMLIKKRVHRFPETWLSGHLTNC